MSIINWKNFLWYCIKFYSLKLFSIVWCKKICLYPTILSIKSRKIGYLKVHKYTLNQYPKPAWSKKPKKFRGSSQPLVWGWLILTYFWPIFWAMYNFLFRPLITHCWAAIFWVQLWSYIYFRHLQEYHFFSIRIYILGSITKAPMHKNKSRINLFVDTFIAYSAT